MKTCIAIALCLLLFAAGTASAADESPSKSEALQGDATSGGGDFSAENPKDDKQADIPQAKPGSEEQDPELSLPYRHRPGACPEGPPCKTD